MLSVVTHNGLQINQQFLELLKKNGLDSLERVAAFAGGTALKQNRFRSVYRVQLEHDGATKVLFLKRHFWPLRERLKALFPWRRREDAANEWRNMFVLDELGFRTMVPVAFGERQRFGIPYFSTTLTEGLGNAEKLETYLPTHFTPPLTREKQLAKRALIGKVAAVATRFHACGLNHQDFYLGHLFLDLDNGEIIIIDIQRAHRRTCITQHDRIKDVGQLAYAARRLGLFRATDFMRFAHAYLGVRKLGGQDKRFLRKVLAKMLRIEKHANKIYARRRLALQKDSPNNGGRP